MYSLLSLVLAASAYAQNSASSDSSADPAVVYSPARPPAVPLAVRSPYTSVWSSTENNGTLNTNGVQFWTGQAVGWEGIIVVDGISYEWMGTNIANSVLPQLDNFKSATPLSVSYDSQYSNFTFTAGPVLVTASFFSPVVPQDLCRTSIPLSYLEVSYESQDNATHSVNLYTDVDNSWNNFQGSADITAGLNVDSSEFKPNSTVTNTTLFTWWYHLSQEFYFSEVNDFPQWGNMTLSTQPGDSKNFTFASGKATNIRYSFIQKGYLSNYVDVKEGQVFAFSHDMKQSRRGSVLYTVGVIQEPVINLLTSEGLQSLNPWWSSEGCYSSNWANLVATHYDDFATVQEMAATWEAQLKTDIDEYYAAEGGNVSSTSTPSFTNASMSSPELFGGPYEAGTDQFGENWIFNSSNGYGYLDAINKSGVAIPDVPEDHSYYAIVALSTRQIMGAYMLTIPPTFGYGNASDIYNSSEPFMFQKEISSNGNMNTVDVLYPAMPFFLYANPNLLRFAMNPLYLNQESGFYPRSYSMHDLGSHYPNATGHVDGADEQMPVEESGNMLLMTYSYYKFTGDRNYLRDHYTKLFQWSQFLIEYTLIPSNQLSTDDFVGTLENQTNLAIKGIVGLQAMAEISTVVGNTVDATNFTSTSSSYYQAWEDLAIDPTGTHTVLAYQWRSSWGLLYNSYPDKLLNLGVIRQEVYDMQSSYYATVSEAFGIPLDNRVSLTKSDWELWTAATCEPRTRRLIVNAIAYWLNHTSTNRAFTDLYETISTGGYPQGTTFIARPVAGGHFSLLALQRAGKNSTTGTSEGGGFFPQNGTEPLPASETGLLTVLAGSHPTVAPTVIVDMGTYATSGSVFVSSTASID
ncbi:Glutaminase [Lasiodiplodia theobromae]|uniref:Glutaminase n=1 Tax=Lasiodiplodia theobromae TaxID=45133 RepID=UPI0015C3A5D3|nr:Glutaminase [Lasiodiplodia theobromae]KAF4538650.1 Glutaminase [Lasiodiplodia theobromae]